MPDELSIEEFVRQKHIEPSIEDFVKNPAKEPSIEQFVMGASPTIPEYQKPSWIVEHPNWYGLYGAAKETGKTVLKDFVPYTRYIFPEERERFDKLDVQHQTRELLLQNLETILILGTSGLSAGGKALLQKYLPKTFAKLAKLAKYPVIGKGKDTVAKLPATLKNIDPDVEAVELLHTVQQAETRTSVKLLRPGVRKRIKHATIDASAEAKDALLKESGKLGEEAVMYHDLARGASARAARMVNEATAKLYTGMSSSEKELFDKFIMSKRIVAIDAYKEGIKHPGGLTGIEHQKWIQSLPSDVLAALEEKAAIWKNVTDGQLGMLRDNGLLGKEAHEELLKHFYTPRQFLHHLDPQRSYNIGGTKITVRDSGIRRLTTGSEEALNTNSRDLLAQVISRTQGRIARNDANKALYEIAVQQPDNPVIRLAKPIRTTRAGTPVYPKTPTGYANIDVMVDGVAKRMLMPADLAKSWVLSDPQINKQLANTIGWLSGSKLLKAMATGLNPEFALTNMPRDIVHAWMTTQEYSRFLPKAALEMGTDFTKVAKDAFLRKGSYIDYIDEGGGMSFLTHQGRLNRKGVWETMQNVLGYIGETSELWTRLAIRNRALKNGKTPAQATWAARKYLDFAQGGSWAKAIDTGIPYLNASIQATRTIFQAAAKNPGEFTVKAGQLATLATGLVLANRSVNKEAWDMISDREKTGNFIVTTPIWYTDDNGERRPVYFKIAKDQSQRLLCTIFESMVLRSLGDTVDAEQIRMAVKDAFPIIPWESLPPVFEAILGYAANKDFWSKEDIWRGPEVDAAAEYTNYTHPAIKEIRKLGLSPERSQYVLEQFFTSGNIYTYLVGQPLREIFDVIPEDKEKDAMEFFLGLPGMRRVMRAAHPYTQYREVEKEARRTANEHRLRQNQAMDLFALRYFRRDDDGARAEMTEYVRKQPYLDQRRLVKRFIAYAKVRNTSAPSFWLNLMDKELPPDAKALILWTKYRNSDKEEQQILMRDLRMVPGVAGSKFMHAFTRLLRRDQAK